MSNLPLAFSAAHISKWDTLPKETFTEKTPRSLADNQPADADHGASTPKTTQGEDEITARKPSDAVAVEGIGGSHDSMTIETRTWITLWFLLSAPVVLWDAGYCLFRPRSMIGGDLHWIWEPYGLYQTIDYVYGVKALEENNGFTSAQGLLNLVETALNIAYVYLTHVSSWPGAPLIGFTSATMTLSKSLLYFAQEFYCGWCSVGHNAFGDLVLLYLLPNGFWIVFPSLIVWHLGCDIVETLSRATTLQHAPNVASKKNQ